MSATRSVLEWRQRQRSLWNLPVIPEAYATMACYAQPQKQDWPVYDGDQGVYVEWSTATSHLESMLELDGDTCRALACISIFHGPPVKERGKSRRGPTFNYKKTVISRGLWYDTLAEKRCTTAKARAARLWLYENNMTYREYYNLHRSILNNYKSGARKELYEPTHSLLLKLPGIEVAAWPILYPWSRYGDTDVRARPAQGGSGTEGQCYSGKQSFVRKLL